MDGSPNDLLQVVLASILPCVAKPAFILSLSSLAYFSQLFWVTRPQKVLQRSDPVVTTSLKWNMEFVWLKQKVLIVKKLDLGKLFKI